MKKILRFGFRFIKLNMKLYIVYVSLTFISSAISIIIPLITGQIIDLLSGKEGIFNLTNLTMAFISLNIIKIILTFITSYQYIQLQSDSGYYSNISIIEKLYKTSFKNISGEDPASLHQMINNDCNTIMIFSISVIKDVILNLLSILFIMIIIYYQSTLLCIMFFIFLGCYTGVYLLFKDFLYKGSLNVKESQIEFFSKLYNLVANLKSIKVNGFFNRVIDEQTKQFLKYQKDLKKQQSVTNLYDLTTRLISLIVQTIIFLYGGKMVISGKMNIGIFVIVSGYFSNLLSSINYFLNLGEEYQNVKVSYDRLIKYDNLPQYKMGKMKNTKISSISFEDVKFSYNDSSYLFNINKKFEKGKIYWLKGDNGSGKTTFLNLLSGIFGTDYHGEIHFNDITAKEMNSNHLSLYNISIVEQRPFILSETLRDNIFCKMDNPKKSSNLSEYEDYIFSNLGLKEFLSKLPNGLDTEFNALTDSLSGGERQKIALARMFLSSADIWILDEPTSALDTKSKENFYDIIEEIKSSRIIFIVSHEELRYFDEIITFNYTSKVLNT